MEAILLTRFILNLRSFDLPKTLVPGEFLSQLDQSAWSSRLVFLNRIKPVDFIGNMGSPLDHGEERGGGEGDNGVFLEDGPRVHGLCVEVVESRRVT